MNTSVLPKEGKTAWIPLISHWKARRLSARDTFLQYRKTRMTISYLYIQMTKLFQEKKNQILSNIKGKELLVFSQRKTVKVSFYCCDKIISMK